jgi:hypothetical protein
MLFAASHFNRQLPRTKCMSGFSVLLHTYASYPSTGAKKIVVLHFLAASLILWTAGLCQCQPVCGSNDLTKNGSFTGAKCFLQMTIGNYRELQASGETKIVCCAVNCRSSHFLNPYSQGDFRRSFGGQQKEDGEEIIQHLLPDISKE